MDQVSVFFCPKFKMLVSAALPIFSFQRIRRKLILIPFVSTRELCQVVGNCFQQAVLCLKDCFVCVEIKNMTRLKTFFILSNLSVAAAERPENWLR